MAYNRRVSYLRALVGAVCGPESDEGRDSLLLQEACYAGLLGIGHISPNPNVGALVVKDGDVVARGVHRICGKEHAEAEALSRAKDRAKGADLYVGLEPCCHQGKQPPCADAIIKAGVARVIYAGDDPDPRTCRRARSVLSDAGVKVDGPLMPRAIVKLNDAYCYRKTCGKLFVTLKLAISLDGRLALASGDSQWLTGKTALGYAHFLRQLHDAVMVGVGTVRADNPHLTVRKAMLREFVGRDMEYIRLRHPVRVVLDPEFSLLHDHKPADGELDRPVLNVFNPPEQRGSEKPWLVFVGIEGKSPSGAGIGEGIEVIEVPCDATGSIELERIWEKLSQLGIYSVLVEGGVRLAQCVLAQRAFVRFDAIVAPLLLGGDARTFAPDMELAQVDECLRLCDVLNFPLGRDTLISGYAFDFIDEALRGMPTP